MSLIGIWGHSAIGKTYWLHSIKDELYRINPNIVIACADDVTEYHPLQLKLSTGSSLAWSPKREQHWKSTKEDRLEVLPKLVADDKVWILDSMRWFIGMQTDIVDAFKANGNKGVHMIAVWSQPLVQQEFRLLRCLALGKPWNEYWDDVKNLKVESNRGINSIKKHFAPAGIPSRSFEIGIDRLEWAQVTAYIKQVLESDI